MIFPLTVFDIERAGHKSATLCHHRATQLKMELLSGTQSEMGGEATEIVGKGRYGMSVGIGIVYAQASTHVDARGVDAVGFKPSLQLVDASFVLHADHEAHALYLGYGLCRQLCVASHDGNECPWVPAV